MYFWIFSIPHLLYSVRYIVSVRLEVFIYLSERFFMPIQMNSK